MIDNETLAIAATLAAATLRLKQGATQVSDGDITFALLQAYRAIQAAHQEHALLYPEKGSPANRGR